MIGPWLYQFVPLVSAEREPSSPAQTDSAPQRYVPTNFTDFAECMHTALYVRLIAADVAEQEVLAAADSLERPQATAKRAPWRQQVITWTKRLHWWGQGMALRRARVVVRSGYFPRLAEAKMWWMSGGRIRFDWRNYPWHPNSLTIDWSLRHRLAAKLPADAPPEIAAILKLVPLHLPRAYLEGFASLGEVARRTLPNRASAYFTCGAIWNDDIFKYHAAEARDAGAAVLVGQHGGNYGIIERLIGEDWERDIADKFCTWGWKEDDKTVPMPSPILVGLRPTQRPAGPGEILFASTAIAKVNFAGGKQQVKSTPDEYLAWQLRFFDTLPSSTRASVRFRTLRDWVGGSWEPLKSRFPEVLVENAYQCGVTFRARLAKCSLFICDHLSTTYVEALASDTPTILFWDPGIIAYRPAAQPHFDALIECGILHVSPESAAHETAKAYADPAAWWSASNRRRAVRQFRDHYALTAPNAERTWVNFLLDEARSHASPLQA